MRYKILEQLCSIASPSWPRRSFHPSSCRHRHFSGAVPDDLGGAAHLGHPSYDQNMYISGVVHTLRPERITSADVIHVPQPTHRIRVLFNPPGIDRNTGLPHVEPPPLSHMFRTPSIIRHHSITLRASLSNKSVGFPSGWGCLYWWTPPSGKSADGEIRYRTISSIASDPRVWSDEAIRDSFQRSEDFRVSRKTPWSSDLFGRVMQRLGYADGIVTRTVLSPVLSEKFAERYMERRRVQAIRDSSLAEVHRFPSVRHDSILPQLDQFDIRDHEQDAIRAALNDTTPVRVYSDGAVHNSLWTGAAAVLVRTDGGTPEPQLKSRRIHLGKMPPFPYNIHDAEVVGLGVALWLAAHEERLDRVSIYADSRLALFAVRLSAAKPGQWRMPDFVLARYDLLMRRHPQAKVTFRWVPSHVGVEGNEMADDLAGEAAVPPKES
ncbi:hypothetical protein BD311DRAFT_565174 [Dichomitus squalens]|uniref:RNase H type-1 domain-containing protein n=1 Tax=Dichomitus squalens TaxID=114155 RepID=A0A4Q9MD27_9APHY|nr:hypothetical protein BD311DRAFT_565174 [Dichomitus squalens]